MQYVRVARAKNAVYPLRIAGVEDIRIMATIALASSVVWALPAAAQHTLDAVKKRGQVVCGVNGQAPGFSATSADG